MNAKKFEAAVQDFQRGVKRYSADEPEYVSHLEQMIEAQNEAILGILRQLEASQ